MTPEQQSLLAIFNAAITAVSGERAVRKACHQLDGFMPDQIIAVGKAAASMALGALRVYHPVCASLSTVIVTKYGHGTARLSDYPSLILMEAGHPIPDERSLQAGKLLRDTVSQLGQNSRLLLLVSGGASALVECLPADYSLARWQQLTAQLIADGLTIGQINQRRKQISQIKDGRLLQHFSGRAVVTLMISDVEGDDMAVIGSGVADSKRLVPGSRASDNARSQLVASNQLARKAAAQAARQAGFRVICNEETLYGDVFVLSAQIGELLRAAAKARDLDVKTAKVIYLFGGEPTITLPPNPGNGGRNQSLALAMAKEIAGYANISVLVAGTDGTDGPTDAAGAVVNGNSFAIANAVDAQLALDNADAGTYLRQSGDILCTGPTGTNVMDLLIAVVG